MSEPSPNALRRTGFFNPYVQISLCILSSTAAEVTLKEGARLTADLPSILPWLGLTVLKSGWTWLGIVFTLLSFFSWMHAIRLLPLSIAYSLTNAVQVLVPVSCWLFLGEGISPQRWGGIVLVIGGLLVVAKPYATLDEKL